jgi:hypothetical protein
MRTAGWQTKNVGHRSPRCHLPRQLLPQTLAQQERAVNVLGELFDGGGRHTSGQEVLAPCIHHFHNPI